MDSLAVNRVDGRRRPERPAPRVTCTAWSRHPITPSRAMRRPPCRRTAAQHRRLPPRPSRRGRPARGRAPAAERRSGPGAGRPTKLYRATHADVIASVPERHYELAGELLAVVDRARRARRHPGARGARRRSACPRPRASPPGARRSRTRSRAAATRRPTTARGGLDARELPLPRARDPPHAPRVRRESRARRRASSTATGDDRMPALEPAAGAAASPIHAAGRQVRGVRRSRFRRDIQRTLAAGSP